MRALFIKVRFFQVDVDNQTSVHRNTCHIIKVTQVRLGLARNNEDDPNKKATFLTDPKNRKKADNINLVSAQECRGKGGFSRWYSDRKFQREV